VIALLRAVPLWLWLLIAGAAILGVTLIQLEHAQGELEQAGRELESANAKAESLQSTMSIQRQLYKDTQAVNDEYGNRLKALQSDKDQMSRDLADGKRRLSVNASCVSRAGDSRPISKPDDASPRLTDSAQRDYLNLRSGIERQRAQIEGLQTYITTVCLKQR
jgi:prophage endopeptidase